MKATIVKVGKRYAVRLTDGTYVSKNGIYTWSRSDRIRKYCLCFTKKGAKAVWEAYKFEKSQKDPLVATVVEHLT